MDTDGEVKSDDAAADPPAGPVTDALAPGEPSGEPLPEQGDARQESEPAPAPAPEPATTEAAAEAAEPSQQPETEETDLLAKVSAEAESEIAAEEAAIAGDHVSPDDELDPELMDIFRDARNEVQESTLASELEDVSAQELLSDATTISRSLGTLVGGSPGIPTRRADRTSGASEDRKEADGETDEEASVTEPQAPTRIEH